MGFAVWIDPDQDLAWAQGTHEYRPMGTAVIAKSDQFRPRDFVGARRPPKRLEGRVVGFYGSLEEVNASLREPARRWRLRRTPAHLITP